MRTANFPASATSATVALVGFLGFVLAALVVHMKLLPLDPVEGALFIVGVMGGMIYLTDLLCEKVHLRASTGLDWRRNQLSLARSATKYIGLVASVAGVAAAYWQFLEYLNPTYFGFFVLIKKLLPVWAVLAVPYILWVDSKMAAPHDGYWYMGRFATLQWKQMDWHILGQHVLGYTIKGFFLPLMVTYLCAGVMELQNLQKSTLVSFLPWYGFLLGLFYCMDVAYCTLGYLFTLRVTDTHIRSADATMKGWVVALICYEPFYSFMQMHYLNSGIGNWGEWLGVESPLFYAWCVAILVLTAMYVWATVMFAGRFSNLTHRGILTNGPYRFTKHPAYIAKCASWWLLVAPFAVQGPWQARLSACIGLVLLNIVYVLRARTEEAHLSKDPVYVAYAEAIRRHGLFRFLSR